MLTIHAEPITNETFAPFGQFYPMLDPQGYALCGELHRFFPDRLTAAAFSNVGFSPILVKKPAEYVITQQEYHTTTWEMILPLNDDMLLHCAPASAGASSGSAVLSSPSASWRSSAAQSPSAGSFSCSR